MEKNVFTFNNSFFNLENTIQQAFGVLQPSADLKSVRLVFNKPIMSEQVYYK